MNPTPESDLTHILTTPEYWINKAEALRASAAAIWCCINSSAPIDLSSALPSDPPIDTTGQIWQVYRMLCGMSLELGYKASLIAKGQELIATHDLELLAEQVCLSVSQKDHGLLGLLTQCVIWEGRYPAPKHAGSLDYFAYLKYENLYKTERTGNTVVFKPIEPDPLCWENYNSLWKVARNAYDWHSSLNVKQDSRHSRLS